MKFQYYKRQYENAIKFIAEHNTAFKTETESKSCLDGLIETAIKHIQNGRNATAFSTGGFTINVFRDNLYSTSEDEIYLIDILVDASVNKFDAERVEV